MTPVSRHPTAEEWIAWIEAGSDPASEQAAHLASCAACREAADSLRELHTARKATWRLPPELLTRRALARRGRPAPATAQRVREIRFAAADVRSGATAAGEPRTLSGSTDGVRVGLLAVPRPADRHWAIRGVAWLEGAAEVRVLLVHDDHVLADTLLVRSGEFAFDEPSPPGWTLEVHPAAGTPLVIRDPEAS